MKVSVMVPTFNRKGILVECIDSIRAQTHEDLEICIYDDGSSDGTEEIVRAIPDKRITFKRCAENHGLGYARNRLREMTTTDFIANHDDDDLSHPQRIELELQAMLEHEAIWVACTRYNIRPGETPEWPMFNRVPPLAKTRENAITSSILMRKAYCLPMNNEGREQDLLWIHRMWRQYGRPLLVLEAPLYGMRYGMPDAMMERRRGMEGCYSKKIEGPMPNDQQ